MPERTLRSLKRPSTESVSRQARRWKDTTYMNIDVSEEAVKRHDSRTWRFG